MSTQVPINKSVRTVDDNTWLIGNKLLIARSSSAVSGHLWSDDVGFFYTISEVSDSLPTSTPLLPTSSDLIRLVHDAGNASAVWKIGKAFLKVKLVISPNTTREHVTLTAMKAMATSFTIPDVHYHAEWAGRYYLVLSEVPGETLAKAWPTMDEEEKCRCVDQVVGVCNELAKLQASYIGGFDRKQLPDSLLIRLGEEKDFSDENLRKNCKEVGMDLSTFVFFHCDLGPANLILSTDGSLGILDWEIAGFVPKEWIRTRFCVADGLNLPGTSDECVDWRRRVQRSLATGGYPEIADEWMAWWKHARS